MAATIQLPINSVNEDSADSETKSVKGVSAWSKALVKIGTAARRFAGRADAEQDSEDATSDGSSTCDSPLASTRDTEAVFSASLLLNFRLVSDEDDADSPLCKAKLNPLSYENAPESVSKVVAPVRRHQNLPVWPLSPTAGSWSSCHRSNSGSTLDDNEKVGRAARSILNKITTETFDLLFEQFFTVGIDKPEHISTIMSEVFDAATKQHHFIPMYADLCSKLEEDPRIASVVEAAGHQHNFRRLLLNQCQVVFEQLLEPCVDKQTLDDEDCLRRKQEALGNSKLIGHLLVNGMVGSKLLVECADELIGKRAVCPEALEALCTLMMVAAPTFDTAEWQYHEKLVQVFASMRKLVKDKADKGTKPRCRFLIRDVLDMRDAGWPNSIKKPAVIHAEQSKATAEHQVAAHEVRTACKEPFDLKAFRRNLAAILGDLTSDRNVSAAVNRVRMAEVPVEIQADQFVDILCRIVEEKRGPPRRCAMAFAAGLGAAEHPAFEREKCLEGINSFFQDVYPDLCNEVPRLPAIVRSEFTPTFCSVFAKGEINNFLPPGVRF